MWDPFHLQRVLSISCIFLIAMHPSKGIFFNISEPDRPICNATDHLKNSYEASYLGMLHFLGPTGLWVGGNQSSGHKIFEYTFCYDYHTSGNRWSDLYNAIGCANIVGTDLYIKTSSLFDSPFLKEMPRYFKSSNRMPYVKAAEIMRRRCIMCREYCHEDARSPWIYALPVMKIHMQHAAASYIKKYNKTVMNITTDISSSPMNSNLPMLPNVTIQYRCGDNVEQLPNRYGFIPFDVILRLIPTSYKFIYILSDPPDRSASNPFNKNCNIIIKSLVDYIIHRHPESTVVAKRGGDPFLDFTRFILSPITICSASTFCFWPSLANNNTVYLPVTYLFGGSKNIKSTPRLGSTIHFFDGKLVTTFTSTTPIREMLKMLNADSY